MQLWLPLVLLPLVAVVPGLLLQLACAVTGTRPPPFVRALGVAWLAGVVATVGGLGFACTVGAVLGALSTKLAIAVEMLLANVLVAWVYGAMLRLPFGRALTIAVIQHVVAIVLATLVWLIVRLTL